MWHGTSCPWTEYKQFKPTGKKVFWPLLFHSFSLCHCLWPPTAAVAQPVLLLSAKVRDLLRPALGWSDIWRRRGMSGGGSNARSGSFSQTWAHQCNTRHCCTNSQVCDTCLVSNLHTPDNNRHEDFSWQQRTQLGQRFFGSVLLWLILHILTRANLKYSITKFYWAHIPLSIFKNKRCVPSKQTLKSGMG